MTKRLVLQLTEDQRTALIPGEDGLLTRRQRNRVQVLLCTGAGDTDQEIADDLGIRVGNMSVSKGT